MTTKWRNPVRATYDWVLRWADRPSGPWALAGFSFAESSFFPIPPDVLLIPLCLAAPHRAFWFATLCTISSVVGGMFGYLIGYAFFESVGSRLIGFYGLTDGVDQARVLYNQYQVIAVTFVGFTPIPYKVFTILAGLLQINFPLFVVASVVGRGGRFFLVAALLRYFGEPMKEFIDRYFNWLTLAAGALIVAGFLMLNFVFR